MKIKVISALFILVCVGIMIAGCSSPSTSSQGNYQQQSNQVNSQSSSNVNPIIGCWVNYQNAGAGTTVTRSFEFTSNGYGYEQITTSGTAGTIVGERPSIAWAKLPNSVIGYSVSTSNGNLIFQYSSSSETLTEQMQRGSPLVYSRTNC